MAALGNRDAVDKALQRLALAGELRRIDRGLYDRPVVNRLTKKSTTPDYRAVLDAITRRDQLRILVDGMTAANDLGMTDAVPARVTSRAWTWPASVPWADTGRPVRPYSTGRTIWPASVDTSSVARRFVPFSRQNFVLNE
ncbi:MAG: hypothetical protein J0I65_28130 [Variovorax sp.]|nr:hypothetical protein [Variovorax sp.]